MCRLNNKCNMFNSEKLELDLSKDMDNIICAFLKVDIYQQEGLETCANCERVDIYNEYNFKQICCNCEKRICLDCFNICKDEEDGFMLDEVSINNFGDSDEDAWICGDCGHSCESCEEYVDEWSIVALLNIEGDYIYCCRQCVNHKGLDMLRKDEQAHKTRNAITYTRELLARGMGDYVNCYDCANRNYDFEYNGKPFEDMNIKELKDFCRFEKIKGYSKLNKADLIEMLEDFIEDMNDNDKEYWCDEGKLFDKDENDIDFYGFWDERADCAYHCCESCVNLDMSY